MNIKPATEETIGAFEAKTHWSRLLEEVQRGKAITITKRGRPVARLVPYKDEAGGRDMSAILAGFAKIRSSVKAHVSIREYIDEGRRF